MKKLNVMIVGANGKTGQRVKTKLEAAGVTTLGVSRSTLPSFDWNEAGNWSEALQGIDAAYLTYHPDLSFPEAAKHIETFCACAKEAGLQHIVLLSGRGEAGAAAAETALQNSGLDWNIIQASWFAQNFSENFMLDQILAGQLIVPEGCAPEPFIDIDDIADVAVATLLEPGLRNRLFEVTGPECLTFAECATHITYASGAAVDVIEVPLEAYLEGLRDNEVPDNFVELLRDLFGQLFDGRNAKTANGVTEALGRSATGFSAYAEKTAKTGIWQTIVAKELNHGTV